MMDAMKSVSRERKKGALTNDQRTPNVAEQSTQITRPPSSSDKRRKRLRSDLMQSTDKKSHLVRIKNRRNKTNQFNDWDTQLIDESTGQDDTFDL